MDPELKQALDDMEKRLSDRLDKTEAKLFTMFDNWAWTYELRYRGASSASASFDERLGYVEERLVKLERFSINPKALKDKITYPPASSL